MTGLTTLYNTRDYVHGLVDVDWPAVCATSSDVPVVSHRSPGRGEQRECDGYDTSPVVVGTANNFRQVAGVVVCDVVMRGTLPQPRGNRSMVYDQVAGVITEVAIIGCDVWGRYSPVADDGADGADLVDLPQLVPVAAGNAGGGPTARSGA